MLSSKEDFLHLIKLGVGNSNGTWLPDTVDWNSIEALAERHGLLGVLVDGLNQLPRTNRPPQTLWLRWIGEVMQGYEQRYVAYRKAVEELGAWYHEHGYRMIVLKGLACGVNWPKPEHRPYGDIDIYLFGKQKEADEALRHAQGPEFKIDNSHHHHTVFQWHGFMVENHYDFLNVHHHKSMAEMETELKVVVERSSVNFHALFLLRHAMTHFAAKEITLRHLLDWGFYAKAYGFEIDWKWLEDTIDCFGMRKLYDVFNAICVDDLGFDVKTFPKVQFDPFLKERVLNDILSPEFSEKPPKGIVRRSLFKYRRWKANEWKHELCYNESMNSAFWSGVKNHLMKPSSI